LYKNKLYLFLVFQCRFYFGDLFFQLLDGNFLIKPFTCLSLGKMNSDFKKIRNCFVILLAFVLLFSFEGFHQPLIAQVNDTLYAEILGPENLQTLKSGLNTLWGFVYGPRLSLLNEDDFSWYSDIDGFLEHGRIINIHKLSPGIHKIIFTVKNGSGFIASDTVTAVVQDQYIEREPQEIDNSMPEFPEDYDGEGVLGICINVSKLGNADSIMILENTVNDSIIEEIALNWARNCKFYPAEERDIPQSTWIVRKYKFPFGKEEIELARRLDRPGIIPDRRRDIAGSEQLKLRREEERRTPINLGTGKPVAVTGLPEPVIQGFTKLSKDKESLVGMIKACIKVNFAGFITEILIIENTFKDDWVEKDLIKMLYNTLYEPVTEDGGPGIRECYTAFVVENNYFKEMKKGNFTTWKDEYEIKFAQLTKGYNPDFSEVENDVESAVGVFRMIAEITPEGKIKNIKEIEKTINRNSVKNSFVDTYKECEYNPAIVKSFPVKSYILPYFSFSNPDYYHNKKMLDSYNLGFQFYVKGDYKLAIEDFKDALFRDSKNDFTGLIPQIIYCYEFKKEKDEKKKLEIYEQALKKNAYYQNFEVFEKLNEDYIILKESLSKNVSFFSLLPEDRYDFNEICSFFSEPDMPQNEDAPYSVYNELKYPDKAREAGLEGTVEIALFIIPSGDGGKVKQARVLKSIGNKDCNKAASKASKKLNFTPATLEGDPANSWTSMPITFSLSEEFILRGREPVPDSVRYKRDEPLEDDKLKNSLQIRLPLMLVKGKSKFSKANDETKGFIRACIEIDSTGIVRDILILDNEVSKDSLVAVDEFALMLAGSVFDPINLKGGPEKQSFLCSFNIEEKFFTEQSNVLFRDWLSKDAFKFPELKEEFQTDSLLDNANLSIDSTSQQSISKEGAPDSNKKLVKASETVNHRFTTDWSKLDLIVKEETDSTTEGILEFLFKIDTDGKVVKLKEMSNSLKNAGKLKDRLFESIFDYDFKPGVAKDIPTNCYVHKKFAFRRRDEERFKDLLKENNSAYKEIIKGNEKNAAKKFEKIVESDYYGDFLWVYPYLTSYYQKDDKVLDALYLYYDGIKRYAFLNDFEHLNHIADELMFLKRAVWRGEDLYSLLPGEKYEEKVLFSILPEENRPKLIESLDSLSNYIEYPKLKDEEMIDGTVIVAALVDKDGNIKETEIKESIGNEKFDKAAANAVKKLKFKPAVYNNEPIEHWFTVPVKFDNITRKD